MSKAMVRKSEVRVDAAGVGLDGTLATTEIASAVVLFAHGSGSSRLSQRNRFVAETLHGSGLATLLFDLLTEQEEEVDKRTMRLRFNIALLTDRLIGAIDWCGRSEATKDMRIGLFGASTGAAAALSAAARRPSAVRAVVLRGGRPDLAFESLPAVCAPTLLIVGEHDEPVIRMNREAAAQLRCEHRIEIVPGASHLFQEPRTLEEVARLSAEWFRTHLAGALPVEQP